ncbi:MAG: hypothetical protein AAGG59_19860 [Bacteroidota bacterium]
MDFSEEELKAFRLKLESDRKENAMWNEKENEYKKLYDQGKLKIEVRWKDNWSDLDFKYLETAFAEDFLEDLLENFTVMKLDLNKVLVKHCGNQKEANKTYPTKRLWDSDIGRSDRKMTKILEFLKNGQTLSPPVIDINENDVILWYDGNHRAALARYLGCVNIPFLVRKSNIDRLTNL